VEPTPELSVIIKTYNEAGKIAACLRSILAETDAKATEIIVADSLSEDETVSIASGFPVKVVQLQHPADRGCGSSGQLGFQYARGKRVLLLDGDMELVPGFLAAAHAALDSDPKLAGVAGIIVDKVLTLEFQRRAQNVPAASRPGVHLYLAGGGLFRMEALNGVGYLTDRNLHACEELELGLRLSDQGWQLRRLDRPSVYHYGHATPPFRLLFVRWRTKYVFGQGELLRAKLGTRHAKRAFKGSLLYLTVVAWWALLLAALAAVGLSAAPLAWGITLLVLLIAPLPLQVWRKGSIAMGLYSVALLNFHAAGLIAGLLRPRIDPRRPIPSVVRHSGA
jgi:glycosyltransferase involved in cell wall biosynthesis